MDGFDQSLSFLGSQIDYLGAVASREDMKTKPGKKSPSQKSAICHEYIKLETQPVTDKCVEQGRKPSEFSSLQTHSSRTSHRSFLPVPSLFFPRV